MSREKLKQAKRWVIKVGSSLVTDNGNGLNTKLMSDWSKQIINLQQQGVEVVLVSSGSVAAGRKRLNWLNKPLNLHEKQVAAAVGQSSLIGSYDEMFASLGVVTAQVLLTHADLQNRQRYLNASTTFRSMLEQKVLPIVNENDTVAVDEIRFGDNDSLAAMVANLIDADVLVLLTDQDGLYDSNPVENPQAQLISIADADDAELKNYAGGSSNILGTGGMATKIKAAVIAARTGASTVIANGRVENILGKLVSGDEQGTLLLASKRMASKKQWLANQLHVKGSLVLDDGAAKVLSESGRSLLPVGVKSVQGDFERGELVSCVDLQGKEIARGLVNYSAVEAAKISGQKSQVIETILGYSGDKELIHRDNLVLL